MREPLVDLALQALVAAAYGVAVLITAGFGLFFEYRSYLFASSGETYLAFWIGTLGFMLLLFSSYVLRDKLAMVVMDAVAE